ncbi:MAG: permease [Candidatus Aquicultor sp.]
MSWARNYRYLIAVGIIYLLVGIYLPRKASIALSATWHTVSSVILIIVSVFILIGLVQVWIKEDMIAEKLGEGSGTKALVLSALFGSILVGPLFAIFPLLKSLLNRGARVGVIVVMLTTWAVKIPMLPLEVKFLGPYFTILRVGLVLALSIPVSLLVEKIITMPGPLVINDVAEVLESPK